MDSSSGNLYARQQEMSTLTFNLLVTLLLIGSVSLFAFCLLVIIRRLRNSRNKNTLPMYAEHDVSDPAAMSFTGSPHTHNRRPFFATRGKQANALQPIVRRDTGPLPEIHIHPAEELDESGKQASGTIVVVQVGQSNAGQEPDDELPPYEKIGPLHARRGPSEALPK